MEVLHSLRLRVRQVLLLQELNDSGLNKAPVLSDYVLALWVFENEETEKITNCDFVFVLGDGCQSTKLIDGLFRHRFKIKAILNPTH